MDYFMADISNVPDVKEGDYAILLGVDGENEVSAMELGGVNQTAPGDVTCAISARVPRIYFPGAPGVSGTEIRKSPQMIIQSITA